MTDSSRSTLRRAEQAVIRAAFACLDRNGWMFQVNDRGSYPLKQDAMRRLENELARLKKARKANA